MNTYLFMEQEYKTLQIVIIRFQTYDHVNSV